VRRWQLGVEQQIAVTPTAPAPTEEIETNTPSALTGSMPPTREQADEGFGERAALSRLN